jgi:hypothetical protein
VGGLIASDFACNRNSEVIEDVVVYCKTEHVSEGKGEGNQNLILSYDD